MSRCGLRCRPLLLAIGAFAIYLSTIVTTVGWTDTGELMAVAHTFGIAHPTGYPLMTMLATGWLVLPTGLRVAVQLNLLSACLVAVSIGLFVVAMGRAFQPGRSTAGNPWWAPFIAAGALATSQTVWLQSSSYEVYALHLALMTGILASYHLAASDADGHTGRMSRWWFLTAWLIGLSFSNHMTTILILPALIVDFIRHAATPRHLWKRTVWMAATAVAGLSDYAVLPLRAMSWPPLNWGDTSSWEALWRHVSGAQYRVWMFAGGDVAARQWRLFLDGLPSEFAWPFLAVAVWGWLVAWRQWRRQAEMAGLLAITGVVYAINYDIHEIGPYFLVVYVAIAWSIVPGVIDLHGRISRLHRHGRAVVPFAAIVMIAWQILETSPRIPAANTPSVETFARTVLRESASDAVILTGRWDYLYSPALYLQNVEHLRQDVVLIDHSLLRDRVWYVEALRRRAPWLDRELAREFDGFLRELRKFERGEPFVPAVIQMRWDGLVEGIIRSSAAAGRTVYADHRLASELRISGSRPEGYLVRVAGPADSSAPRLPGWIPVDGNESPYLNDFREYLAAVYHNHALALSAAGERLRADSLAALSASVFPRRSGPAPQTMQRKKLGE